MSFFGKLKNVISKVFNGKEAKAIQQEIEDILIMSDFGVELSERFAKDICKSEKPLDTLKSKIAEILDPLIQELEIYNPEKMVIIMSGVNGSGKTTTVAKLVHFFQEKGSTVDLAACDTFRAAATEQLENWAKKLGCRIFKADNPRDPSSVAFECLEKSEAGISIIDTAGRLHNNTNLMNELSKIYRTVEKKCPIDQIKSILVIDSTTGQNAIDQVREFKKIIPIDGIILTKLDGNSRGGAIVRIASEYQIPILGVGIGESECDFKKFSVERFLEDFKI